MKEITRQEYVKAEEEDDGGIPITENHAFPAKFHKLPYKYYIATINQKEFENLHWFSNGTDFNELNLFSGGTRRVGDVIKHFQDSNISSAEQLFNHHKADYNKIKGGFEKRRFFRDTQIDDKIRRLFLIDEDTPRIHDGCKRASHLCSSIAKGESFEPLTIYIAKLDL